MKPETQDELNRVTEWLLQTIDVLPRDDDPGVDTLVKVAWNSVVSGIACMGEELFASFIVLHLSFARRELSADKAMWLLDQVQKMLDFAKSEVGAR